MACAALGAALLLPGLLSGPNFDASVFLLIGGRMIDGARPYADLWDHKPPGIYVWDAALLGSLGRVLGPWPAVWLGTLALHVVMALSVFRALGGRSAASVVAALLVAAISSAWPFALGGGLTESLAAGLLAGAFLVALRSTSASGWLGSGLLAGLACAASLYAAPGLLSVLTVVGIRSRVRGVLLGLVGAGAVGLSVVGVAAATGTLPAMLDALVTYNAAYRAASIQDPLPESLAISAPLVGWYLANTAALVIPALLAVPAFFRPGPMRPLAAGAAVWIVATAFMVLYGGRLYGHYVLMIVPALGLLAGVGLRVAWGSAPPVSRRVAVMLGMGLAVAVSGAAIYASLLTSTPDAYSSRERDRAAGAYIGEATDRGDPVLVWGNAPMVYELSDTMPAWRYVYLLPLLTPGYVTEELVGGLVAHLEDSPPCFVLDAGSPQPGAPGLAQLLIDRPLTPSERRVDLLDPVRAFVADRYEHVGDVDGWPVYRLVSGACG